jgi:hypothetical protein
MTGTYEGLVCSYTVVGTTNDGYTTTTLAFPEARAHDGLSWMTKAMHASSGQGEH